MTFIGSEISRKKVFPWGTFLNASKSTACLFYLEVDHFQSRRDHFWCSGLERLSYKTLQKTRYTKCLTSVTFTCILLQ